MSRMTIVVGDLTCGGGRVSTGSPFTDIDGIPVSETAVEIAGHEHGPGWGRLRRYEAMRRTTTALALTLACTLQCSCLQETKAGFPPDVTSFVKDRDICDHLAGEVPDPGQETRAWEVVDGIEKYCKGTDKKLEFLRAKYARNPDVMRRLNDYEESIERPAKPAKL